MYEITNIGRAVYDYNEPNHPLHVGFVSGPKAEASTLCRCIRNFTDNFFLIHKQWKVELGEEPGSFTFQNVLYNTNAVASFDVCGSTVIDMFYTYYHVLSDTGNHC